MKMLHSQRLSFLKNGLNIFTNARHLPDRTSWRNPSPTGEIIGNSASRRHAGVIRDIETLPRRAKRNHFHVTVIASRGASRALSYSAFAMLNVDASVGGAVR